MDIAGAIREVFGFLRIATDPKARKAAYQLRLSKYAKKALEHAERYILLSKELMYAKDTKLRKKILQALKHHEKHFFKYN